MNVMLRNTRAILSIVALAGVLFASSAAATETVVVLSGDQEVPAVETSATGSGSITVNTDKTVSGSVTTYGIVGTMAHIHEAAPGENGSVVIPLKQIAPNIWSVPADAKLTDAQYKSFEAGDLYVNVHSQAHPGGEIRGQLKP
jgi:hypothetical protein